MSQAPELLSRDEVLGGLPARRARSLVFLIERQAVRQTAERAIGTMALVGEGAARNRELAWLEAFATTDDEELRRPTIQEIEASAPSWGALVPKAAPIRAAAARILAERHRLDRARITGIRAALGLDDDTVAKAYRELAGEPLTSIYSRSGARERVRWAITAPGRWLETTPPFWAAAALTFLLSMGQTIVIVPIAVATVGVPIAAISILVFGILALTATAAMAEATTRNGEVRLRGGFFGRLVTSALGTRAGAVPSILGIAGVVLPTVSTFVGLALLLHLTIPLPAVAWVAILGAVGIAIPLRDPRTTSFGGLMAFGLFSAVLLAGLSATILIEGAIEGTLHSPPLSPPNDIGIGVALGVIIGVLLGSFADPVYAVQIGRLVLPRDPDGRGYVRGSVAGMAAFVLVTTAFSAVLLFVVPASDLAAQSGSALDPVAEKFGVEVVILSTIIGIGLFGIRLYGNAIALFDFVGERLPGRPAPRVALRAGRGRLLLSRPGEHGVPLLTLAYSGLDKGRPVVAIAGTTPGGGSASLPGPGEQQAIEAGGSTVRIEVVDAGEDLLRLALSTDLEISYDGDATASGPGVAASLLAGDESAELATWLLRAGGADAAEASREFEWSPAEARRRLEALAASGRAEATAGDRFRVRLGRRRASALEGDVWKRLGVDEETAPKGVDSRFASAWTRALGSSVARAAISSVPTAGLAAISAALIAAGTASVSGPIRIVGVIAFATISGVLPPMLLLAARRRSDLAGVSGGGWLVGSALLVLSALTAFAVLILHATVFWTDPFEQAIAAIAAVLAVAAVVLAARHNAFRGAVLVELRQRDEGGPAVVRVESGGRPFPAELTVGGRRAAAAGIDFEVASGEEVTISAASAAATEVRLTAQRFDPTGAAHALALTAALDDAEAPEADPIRLEETGGTAVFRSAGDWTLRLSPEKKEEPKVGRRRARPGSPLDQL